MNFHIITLFPQMFASILSQSIVGRAQDQKRVTINFVNPRDFAKNKYKTVDDKPYGGGPGMIMKVDIIVSALESIKPKPYTILLSASGKKYNQKIARSLKAKKNLAVICGHYEGTDARVEKFVDEVISIGDYILTGGEIAAMAIVDSITRLIPGVINHKSLESESFSPYTSYPVRDEARLRRQLPTNSIEYPQYTRPEEFRNFKVPKILLSGNHQSIKNWRLSKLRKISY